MFTLTGIAVIILCMFGILFAVTRDPEYMKEDTTMKKYTIYHGYCSYCKEEVGGHWSENDPEKTHVHCNQCGHAIDLPEDLLEELRENDE